MNPMILNLSQGNTVPPRQPVISSLPSVTPVSVAPVADMVQFAGARKKPGLLTRVGLVLAAIAAPFLLSACDNGSGNQQPSSAIQQYDGQQPSSTIQDTARESIARIQQYGSQQSKTISEMIADGQNQNSNGYLPPDQSPVQPGPTDQELNENILRQRQGLDAFKRMPDGNPETIYDPLTGSHKLDPRLDPYNPRSDKYWERRDSDRW